MFLEILHGFADFIGLFFIGYILFREDSDCVRIPVQTLKDGRYTLDPEIVYGGGTVDRHIRRLYEFADWEADARHRQIQSIERVSKDRYHELKQRLDRIEKKVEYGRRGNKTETQPTYQEESRSQEEAYKD